MSSLKQGAYDVISHTVYHKETHQWGFKSLVTNMSDSHSLLSEYGEPIPERRKM